MARFLSTGTALSCLIGVALSDAPWFTDAGAYDALTLGNVPNQTFRSSPIIAPLFLVNAFEAEEIDKTPYLFLEWGIEGLSSPMIFRSDDLSLVYADQQYAAVDNVLIQTVHGKPALTFWEGEQEFYHGNGHAVSFDNTYTLVSDITPVDLASGRLVDLHEFQVTDDGTALICIYESVSGWNLTSVGGPADGMLLDHVFQEIDIDTGELLFQWRATDHVDIADSYDVFDQPPPAGWPHGYDGFHMNSLDKVGDNYLVNSPSMSSAYLVNGTDGSIIWTLGGKKNMFEDLSDGNALNFGHQHHPRFIGSELTMFDNHDRVPQVDCTENCSRALRLELDLEALTARTVAEYFHPRGLVSIGRGGHVTLPNDNVLVAWGTQPAVTEHKGDRVVMDIQVGALLSLFDFNASQPYRAFKMEWEGRPTWDPSIAVEDGTVYVSWNGATEVTKWVILASHRPQHMNGRHVIATASRNGFETPIRIHRHHRRYIRAAALDCNDEILGSTAVFDTRSGGVIEVDDKVTSCVV